MGRWKIQARIACASVTALSFPTCCCKMLWKRAAWGCGRYICFHLFALFPCVGCSFVPCFIGGCEPMHCIAHSRVSSPCRRLLLLSSLPPPPPSSPSSYFFFLTEPKKSQIVGDSERERIGFATVNVSTQRVACSLVALPLRKRNLITGLFIPEQQLPRPI